MAPGTEGGFTKLYPEEKVMPIYDAVVEYKGTDLVVIGGKEYGQDLQEIGLLKEQNYWV